MSIFNLDAILSTFEVIVDTREQPTLRAKKRYESMGVSVKRNALDYGDYTYQLKFDDGYLLESDKALCGLCVIERKMNIDELALCFGRERKRFEREFNRAREHKAKVYLLIEDGTWEHLINGKYKSKMHPASLYNSLIAWMVRYDISVIFCKAETSGKMIKEILYRDARERILDGEFDGRMDKVT